MMALGDRVVLCSEELRGEILLLLIEGHWEDSLVP